MPGFSRRAVAAAIVSVALSGCAGVLKTAGGESPWRPIFNGRTLEGWTPKIVGQTLGADPFKTFIVKDGAIQVSYAGYGKFANQFGHLFYKTPFGAYRLRLDYKVLEPGLPDTPAWARGNSGVMFDSQRPENMTLNQPFPVSVEFQILGRDGEGPRPTGSVCTPGTNIAIDGVMAKVHCTLSTGPTIPNETWTHLELEVLSDGEVTHRINGVVVHHYAKVELDPADPLAKREIADRGGVLPVTGGYISLQSEGHPIAFKNIEIQVIPGAR